MLILLILLVIVMYPICIYSGYKIALRSGVDYKKRWEEALNLVKQLETFNALDAADIERVTKTIDQLKIERAKLEKVKAELPPPKGNWRLETEYKKIGYTSYALFYAVKGREKVEVGRQSDPSTYKTQFQREIQQARVSVNLMNSADA